MEYFTKEDFQIMLIPKDISKKVVTVGPSVYTKAHRGGSPM
jgi:hypothetical protein